VQIVDIEQKSLKTQVAEAQQGSGRSREMLLETYQPYIYQTASRYCKRFLQEGKDEELQVALMAFNEAIDSYQDKHGSSFLSFSRIVIERRLCDYFRKTSFRQTEIPFSEFVNQEEAGTATCELVENNAAQKEYAEQLSRRDRQEEILYFKELLGQHNITLAELVKISPKHADARRRALEAAKTIVSSEKLLWHFQTYGELPLKELENKVQASRKTLERQRKYIVSLLLVYLEDLPHIREYLKGVDDVEDPWDCPGSGKK
jgi:RNA polymerase sigma factor